jgi:DNA-binding GntR family transcriptional regulator
MDSDAAPRTLASQVADRVRDAIIRGELPSGQPLKQAELAARFGVSPIPLREGLRLLEAERFVTLHPYRGATVTPASAQELRELIEIFLALESLALRRSFPRLTARHFVEAAEVLFALEASDTLERWSAFSYRFVLLFLAPANRPRLLETIRGVVRGLGRYWLIGHSPEEHRTRFERACREILAALLNGDLEGTMRLVEGHVSDLMRVPLAILDEDEARDRSMRGTLPPPPRTEAES